MDGFSIGILVEPVTSLAISTVLGLMYGVLIGRLIAVPARHFNYVLKRLSPAMQTRFFFYVRTVRADLLFMLMSLLACHSYILG